MMPLIEIIITFSPYCLWQPYYIQPLGVSPSTIRLLQSSSVPSTCSDQSHLFAVVCPCSRPTYQ